MRPTAPGSLLLASSFALVLCFTVSWEIKMTDLEEKDVDEFSSSGFRCPTCFAVRGKHCDSELKWCAADKIKCIEFSGIVNTGFTNIPIEMKRCIREDLCTEAITAYMGLPIANKSRNCKSAVRNGARVRPPTPIFLVLFLGKLLH